jgi:tetratricopeptide (TPR) repeat protein
MLGQILHQSGDLSGSKSELQEAVKRQPENPMILQALAETYRDAHEYETAREYTAHLLKLNPNNLQAHFVLATIDIGAKDFKGALEELDIVEKGAPNDPMVHLNKAFAYYGLKNVAESEREFQAALKLNPQYDAAVSDYVSMLFASNQAPRALQVAQQYAAANPNRTQAQFIYGSALADVKKFDQAVTVFQSALKADPKAIPLYLQLGRVYETMGNTDGALSVYKQALELQPNAGQLNTNVGNMYLAKNDLDSALKYYKVALQANRNDPVAANDVAWVYAVQGKNLDEALSLAIQAKQQAPNLVSINDTLAWIQYKKGNYQLSISLLEDALKANPQSAEFRYHLGMALNGAGDKGRAKAELQKALSLNLKGNEAQDAQQTLASLQN